MSSSEAAGSRNRNVRAAMKKLSERIAQKLAIVAQELEKGEQPSPDEIDELERLGKLDAVFKSRNGRSRRTIELFALIVIALVLIGLCFIKLPSTSVDAELHATDVRFRLDKGTSTTTLIPGETGQILTLKRVTVSGIETMSPQSSQASINGGSLQLKAATPPATNTRTVGNYDPSVRLFAIALPSQSALSVHASVAYSGNSRGLNLATEGTVPVNAAFGEVIVVPSITQGVKSETPAINEITVEGKDLRFALYPADELHDLAVFRDVHISGISFEDAGRSTILSGTVYIKGRGASGLALRPSDLLVLSSEHPMLLREITLTTGELKVIVSAPKATTILLGEDSPRDLRPTLFQWILYRWPSQLYATLSALIAAWLALRRWWESRE
jgi:hypothetical protein